VKPFGKTLFIDNKADNLDSVDERGEVDVLNRGAFEEWTDLLQKSSSLLNIRLLKIAQYSKEVSDEDSVVLFYKDALDYSKLVLRKNAGEFLFPEETVHLRALRTELPMNMARIAKLLGCNGNVWNEDCWPQCFEEISEKIDERVM
jgi:hypothetical protein